MCATKCLVRFIEHGNGQGTYCWWPAGRSDHAPDVSASPRITTYLKAEIEIEIDTEIEIEIEIIRYRD